MLCTACQRIFTPQLLVVHSTSIGELRIHHRSSRSLKHAIALGCYICNRLWASLRTTDRDTVSALAKSDPVLEDVSDVKSPGTLADSTEPFITAFGVDDGPPYGHLGWYQLKLAVNVKAMITSEMMPSRACWCDATFVLQPRDSKAILSRPHISPLSRRGTFSKIRISEPLSQNTKSIQLFDLAKSWIADCEENHPLCNKRPSEKDWYPTRLLEIQPSNSAGPHWRLIETRHSAIDGPYLTLSHCWGSAECIKLTTENYHNILLGLPSTILPQLYQDVLYVALNLGITYLWIDSLCIIQNGDGFADWRQEASLMGEVYSNSSCNISAVDVPDAHHSLFCARNPESLRPEVTYLTTDGQPAPYVISHLKFWESEVSHALVNSRAWVLQERLLSRRILHFGVRQLLWECQTKVAAEVYPDGLPPEISTLDSRIKSLSPARYIPVNCSNVAAHLLWPPIVEKYTACSLTFPNDKLVALSGIAKVLRPILQDEYVAGMWRRYLACELLWNVTPYPEGTPLGHGTYRAPSWSWASTTGAVAAGRPDIQAADVLITVESLGLEYSTDDNTGLIRSGWLRLRGMLKQILLVKPCLPDTCNTKNWNVVINGLHFSALDDYGMQETQLQVMLDSFHNSFKEQNANAALYCMPGRVRRTEEGSIYILLLEVVDRGRGIFRRIGLARGWGMDLQAKVLTRSDEESRFPCEEYTEDGHLICII
ncbi:heterokaryon incompatibility protein [Pochonia chlamydosporia 170]|uniref:Heterokaryon incompatibility protein n=1 Tax=Pochonia chlamydosporia 170 TaxID=1380566 RepID=A0A179F5G1_METCM|nr:heterokaryon incompatibility protein [Pochonia chlamydosporia 170]OAQ60664.1 heterokaryon incompatibility protein [Pochonia chlamydosporia 170]